MSEQNFDPLLRDLIADSDYGLFRAKLKSQALGKIRWRRRLRCAGFGVFASALAFGVLVFTQWPKQPLIQSPQRKTPPVATDGRSSNAPLKSGTVKIITEEQLIASFPPGSCKLVEVNNQKVLIFLDPALRDEVMR